MNAGEVLRAAALSVLLKCCAQDLEWVLKCNAAPEDHLGLPLSVIALADREPELAAALYARPLEVLALLDDVTVQAQTEVKNVLELRHAEEQQRAQHAGSAVNPEPIPPLNVYDNVHVRLVALPSSLDPRPSPLRPPLSRLGCAQLHQLLSVTGTVVRGGPVRMYECNQLYECTRCRGRFGLKCSLEGGGAVEMPDACPIQRDPPCPGSKFQKVPGVSIYSGFQEIRLQAATACLGLGEPPASLTVVLQDELTDAVKLGDSMEVVGVLVPRWLTTAPGRRCELELVLVANNVLLAGGLLGDVRRPGVEQSGLPRALYPTAAGSSATSAQVSAELVSLFEEFWVAHVDRPMLGRNKILAGVCPGVAGLLPVKLAVLLVLLGGVARRDEGGSRIRGELHLLLLGDPGTGKSQIMKWACRASPGRAVLTTGRGSSGAGLTVAATREGNSWALEAGALVLADGGLCCIDEFDGIRPQERAVIHEAMEQQTVHVAKAGLVTSLNTRTAIIGAINPRPGTAISCSRPLTDITGLEGPLLSRFDLVLLLADPRHPDWDRVVAGHVLARGGVIAGGQGEADPVTQDGAGSQYLSLPALDGLKAPVPGLAVVAGGGPLDPLGRQLLTSSTQGSASQRGQDLSIAQRVAARLKGNATGVMLPPSQDCTVPSDCAGGWQGAPAAAGSGKCAASDSSSSGSSWTLEVIRAYVAWVRGRPPPVMTHEAEQVLVAFYGTMRRAEERNAARSTIRALESLIRVSQAHARLLCSDRVLLCDAVAAVVLANSSLQLLHVPGADTVTSARFPADPDAELRIHQHVVLTALGLTALLPAGLPAPT